MLHKKLLYKNLNHKAVTLPEILLAVSFIAMAFIPIMGLLGNSIKITDKDQANIIAMNLCQEKLNTALQFEFNHFKAWIGSDITGVKEASGTLELDLFPKTINGIDFTFKLKITDRPGNFTVASRDFDNEKTNNVADWIFLAPTTISYSDLVHRYQMSVEWKDRTPAKDASGKALIKEYSLVTFKARIKR